MMKQKSIFVTGGAGYIGSHTVRNLLNKGYRVTIFDNLERGYKQAVDILAKESKKNLTFVKGDLRNRDETLRVLSSNRFDGVIHFAAYCVVDESNKYPEKYYDNNIAGTNNLLFAMTENNIKRIIFSSTCVVYQIPKAEDLPITEKSKLVPINPYGLSKYCAEKIIKSYSNLKGIEYVILRYFNPCGASLDGLIGESKQPSTMLMTNAVKGALDIEKFNLTCGEVNTPDRTTIRDYFNVLDLAEVHEIALNGFDKGIKNKTFNVGLGKGTSTMEIINLVKEATGVKFEINKGEQRKNEIPEIYANVDKFKNSYNWSPKFTLKQAVDGLIKFYKKYPKGYEY